MAVWICCSGQPFRPVDHLILEVGLGGSFDSTNAVPHHYNVITRLGMDHENILGKTLVEVAGNKFGIVGPGSRVVHAEFPSSEVEALAREVQAKTKSSWIAAPKMPFEVEVQNGEPRWILRTPWGKQRLTLPGRRAAENASVALTAFQALGHDPAPHLGALDKVRWPGRMERWNLPGVAASVYASGDHNPQGVQSLLELLPHYPRKHLHVLLGVGVEKDLTGILAPFLELPDTSVYLTETPFRGRAISDYGSALERCAGAWAEATEAFRAVCEKACEGDLVLVTGSLYLVGFLRGAFLGRNDFGLESGVRRPGNKGTV